MAQSTVCCKAGFDAVNRPNSASVPDRVITSNQRSACSVFSTTCEEKENVNFTAWFLPVAGRPYFRLSILLELCVKTSQLQVLQKCSRAYWLIFIINKKTDTFSRVCPVIDNEFRHNIVKVAVDPRGDSRCRKNWRQLIRTETTDSSENGFRLVKLLKCRSNS